MQPAVLYVDDDRPNLDLFRRWFDDDLRVLTADSGEHALEILAGETVGVLVSDQRMPEMTGIDLLARVHARWPHIGRMLLTAYSDRDLLLDAIQRGHVQDYVLKPWTPDDLRLRLRRMLDAFVGTQKLEQAALERDLLDADRREREAGDALIGLDAGLADLGARIARVAPTDSTVIIRGETGVGKELVARELHRRSPRAHAPFVRANCAAFSEGVLESELFGHEAGAFTGAQKTRIGRFEQAHGGTILLDEIGDISPAVQLRLLRVLETREFERVGGNRTIRVDIRVIAATNRPLEDMVRRKEFREDLFFRLQVVPLVIPPLRERVADIEPLARHFLGYFARNMGKRLELSPDAIVLLRRYDWPGNVRELRNIIERAAALADAEANMCADDLMFDFAGAAADSPPPLVDEITKLEGDKLREAMRRAGGSTARAARLLGLPRTTLADRLRRFGLR